MLRPRCGAPNTQQAGLPHAAVPRGRSSTRSTPPARSLTLGRLQPKVVCDDDSVTVVSLAPDRKEGTADDIRRIPEPANKNSQ
jgi:hypothetical protein